MHSCVYEFQSPCSNILVGGRLFLAGVTDCLLVHAFRLPAILKLLLIYRSTWALWLAGMVWAVISIRAAHACILLGFVWRPSRISMYGAVTLTTARINLSASFKLSVGGFERPYLRQTIFRPALSRVGCFVSDRSKIQ